MLAVHPAESLAAVIRSVSLYADAVASLPLRALKRTADGGAAEVVPLPALAAWSFPDKELLASDCLLSGNGYGVIDPISSTFATHPATHVVVEVDQKTGTQWYRAKPLVAGAQERLYKSAQVAHIRFRAFGDARVGRSPLAIGKPSIDSALEQTAAARSIFRNMAAAGTVLSAPGRISKETAETLRTTWDENVGGRNKGKTAC